MTLTLRDEFGDLVKWKVILIVEMVLLAVFGSLVFPGLVGDALKGKPGDGPALVTPGSSGINGIVPTHNEIEFEGIIVGGVQNCGKGTYCVIVEIKEGESILVKYPAPFGIYHDGDVVFGKGIITEEGSLIMADMLTLRGAPYASEERR
ncbi:MAG: hypothetical protein JXB14_02125 [Candidatus Altiarchaeota archaeon]|nr:hypothetical protein [Candidatus Altiarchaeota archaeon]